MSQYNRIEVSQLSGSAGNVSVVLVTERRLQEQTAIQELAAELESLVAENRPKNVLLNLSRVDFISSAALNRLITYHNRVKKAGGQLKLSNLKPQIEEVFAITRLNKHFDIRPDEPAALASY
jgi:anti-sigma B factor antagonist